MPNVLFVLQRPSHRRLLTKY